MLILMAGLPLYAGIGLVALVAMWKAMGLDVTITLFGILTFSRLFSFLLITIPLFVFMAEVIMFSGIGSTLYTVLHKWFGHLPGGLAMASIGACAMFGAMCGTTSPTVAAVGVVAVPEMMQRGYDERLATGTVATAGGLATLIPPSATMIIYSFIAEVSLGKLFIAGIIPGIILTTLMMTCIGVRVTLNPSLAPRVSAVSWREKFSSLTQIWHVAILVLVVLGAIYLGISTPSEAAGVGAIGAVVIALVTKRFTTSNIKEALLRAVRVTSFIFLIIVSALLYGYALSYYGVSQGFAQWLLGLEVNRYVVLALLVLMYLILGCVLEQASIIMITTPIVLPIVLALGFDPLWYGILVVVTMEIAGVTPPVGFNLYVVKSVAPKDVKLTSIISGAFPLMCMELLLIGILIVFPTLALWLPGAMS